MMGRVGSRMKWSMDQENCSENCEELGGLVENDNRGLGSGSKSS